MYATQEQLKYLSDHMTECRKHGYNKYRMLIVSDSNETGKKNAQIMQSIYPEGALKDNSGGYRDFSIEFTYNWQRDQAVTDVNTAVGRYRQQHFQVNPVTSDADVSGSDPYQPPTGATDTAVATVATEEKSNVSTYILIGIVVVAVALLLLIPNK